MKTHHPHAGTAQLISYFDLVDFRLLLHVAEALSLSRGAELSNMSAPAASTRIKKIEEVLGTKLFVRNSHGLSPTPLGLSVLKNAKKILSQFENMLGELSATSNLMKGDIRLHANTLSTHGSMPNMLQRYLLQYPEINIILQEHASSNITRSLVSGEADIGILASETRSDRLEYLPYSKERLVLVTPLSHPLCNTSSLHFHQTLGADFIGLPEHAALQHFIMRVARDEGASIKLRIQVNNFDALCKLVETGIGIAVIPEAIAISQARTRRIAIVKLLDQWAVRELNIALRKGEPPTLPVQRLIDTLLERHL
jgi:DNA-binding transcriptional LysR family regulator